MNTHQEHYDASSAHRGGGRGAPPVTPAGGPPDSSPLSSYEMTAEEFRLFRDMIHEKAGIALGDGKRQLLVARLSRRLRALGLGNFSQYYAGLKSDPQGDEMRRMLNAITTNKTDFFREKHHFEYLRDHVLPEARARVSKGAPRRLRIWSAACSTGEEPYTIAMTVLDALGPSSGWDVKILASDIDTNVLATAEEGVYAEERIASLPEAVKRAHFLRGKGKSEGYVRVRPELQRMVSFRRINFIEAPWPIKTQFDVIFCRNVIIYFNRETQRVLFERMAEKMAPHAYLFVGHSENLFWLRNLFTPVQPTVYVPHGSEKEPNP